MKLQVSFFAKLVAVLAMLACCGESHAVSCVENATALSGTLAYWKGLSTNATIEIRIAQGTYSISGTWSNNGNANLSLLGGYQPGTNCSDAGRVIDPTNTVLDGTGGTTQSSIGGSGSTIIVDGLTFANYTKGMSIDSFSGPVTARRFIATNTLIDLGASATRVENCLVYGAPSGGYFGALTVFAGSGQSAVVTNCTVADNSTYGLYTDTFDGGSASVYNTIVWGNSGDDVYGDWRCSTCSSNGNPPVVSYSTFGSWTGIDSSSSYNSQSSPQFVNETGHNYQLTHNGTVESPAIDAGTQNVPGGVPSTDITGGPRVVGGDIDQGAYEAGLQAQFTVTSTLDATNVTNASVNCNTGSTTCTLAEAVVRANAATSGGSIFFNLPGGCPVILGIGSTLDITGKVDIGGYSQPGSTYNTGVTTFNANLCVEVVGNGAGVGLHVPSTATSAHLGVSGLLFAAFSDTAIKLESGTGTHLILGNQIGSSTFKNANGVRVTGNAKAAIGGLAAWQKNLIVDSTNEGVVIDSSVGNSTVANNLIGVAGDGAGNAGNGGDGVNIYNSAFNSIFSNVIGNNSQGVLIGGTGAYGNGIQSNFIGTNFIGSNEANTYAGVELYAGAKLNIIGTLTGNADGNYISQNGGAGVALDSDAGTGNSILANSIWNNTGMPIDLGNDGATWNNNGNQVHTGPNNWQNAALVNSPTYRVSNGEIVTGFLYSYTSSQPYRIDLYYAAACRTFNNSSGSGTTQRADTTQWLGSTTVTTDSSGFGTYSAKVSVPSYALGYITATATGPDGSTSETGNCAQELNDEIFKNGFD